MVRPQRIEPKPGQESVWDYPRPPRVEDSTRHIEVIFNGAVVADTRRSKRVLETSSPPVYYLVMEDVRMDFFAPTSSATLCEWKGQARYYTITVGGQSVESAAWSYPDPTPPFEELAGYIAVYPGKMDGCLLDGERVTPQAGDYYGGWITHEIVGPFKGEPDTLDW
jgi:uncharacterized protein (DUF427 family)